MKNLLFIPVFLFFTSLAFPQAKYIPFNRIMLDEMRRYPKMEVQDVYKLVYQAALGNQHAAMDSAMVFDWLNDEWKSADTANPAPEIEPITPDSALVRVNLGAYKKHGGDKQSLGMKFLYTAKHFKGSKKIFLKFWNDVELLAKKDLIPFTKQALADYLRQMKEKGLPAVHHSEKYMQLYKPSYRVISIDHGSACRTGRRRR